ncbi:hypothetical protein F4604DRAFT_1685871 [Suillus subluteus]|nr:hypothetical protein F4604DRAFT_1685871 [Suillus subluteus]
MPTTSSSLRSNSRYDIINFASVQINILIPTPSYPHPSICHFGLRFALRSLEALVCLHAQDLPANEDTVYEHTRSVRISCFAVSERKLDKQGPAYYDTFKLVGRDTLEWQGRFALQLPPYEAAALGQTLTIEEMSDEENPKYGPCEVSPSLCLQPNRRTKDGNVEIGTVFTLTDAALSRHTVMSKSNVNHLVYNWRSPLEEVEIGESPHWYR